MPELPEVQTVVNDLQILTGDTIIGFWSDFEKAIKTANLKKQIVGEKIKSIQRLSKNIVIELENSTFILLHLKMTGKLILTKSQKLTAKIFPEKHLHHVFYLQKNGQLNFNDIRKFATLELVDEKRFLEIKKTKGLDPFAKDFTLQNFEKIILSKKNKNIKSVLMNQTLIAGIGNIYACEIPYDAKLNPLRKIESLNKKEIQALYKSTLSILTKAIKLRGTSISDYRDAKGQKGNFQNHLKVYGKAGKKCLSCDTIIVKNIVEQRSTFHCPACQK
ncbi:MAG: DNA-formamidopyrimidine glycosylase [Candidatus Moranbacteria bacterium]|nr:DNA-formamidopyrimidine glycosylase [Candidatus Moranbacteria bacterium]